MSIASNAIFKRKSGDSRRFLCTSQDGSKVVIYEDSSVRWCNSSDSKYEFMSLNTIIGDVEHVILSPTGTFLLLYNFREIRIVEIPWDNPQALSGNFEKFRYLMDSKQTPTIKQVLFHPLGYRENCIIILKSDNTIHLLDIYYRWDQQPTELVLNHQSSGAFGIEGLILDIESLTFSCDGLILYALSVSEGCDIYAFYPCLPRTAEISSQKVDLLMRKSLVQYENLTVTTPDNTKRNTIKQFQFLSRIRQSLGHNEVKTEVPVTWLRVGAQGPFTIAPFPNRYYDRTAAQLEVLPIGINNDLILMTLDDGTIAILYKDLEMSMNWDSWGYSYNNSLVLIESINLPRGKLVLRQGTLGQFFILTNSSDIYLIDTSPWSKVLSTCIDNSDLEAITNLQFKSAISRIASVSQVDSYAMWKNGTERQDVFVSKNNVFVNSSSANVQPELTLLGDRNNVNVDTGNHYEVAFSQPISEILSINDSFQLEAKKPLSSLIDPSKRQIPLNNDSNEEQLELLTTISREFLHKIASAQAVGVNLHNRCLEQQYELTRQLQYTATIILNKQKELQSRSHNQSLQLESKIRKQDEILQRFKNLDEKLQNIMKSPKFREMNINPKEMAWFREIRNQVMVFNQYVYQQKALQERLHHLQKEVDKIGRENGKNAICEKSKSQWQKLLSILENDTRLIKECSDHLALASSQV